MKKHYGSHRQGNSSKPLELNITTYTAGEDNERLASAARNFGLKEVRVPRKQIRTLENTREQNILTTGSTRIPTSIYSIRKSIRKFGSSLAHNVGLVFSDCTLEVATMHSVDVMAPEELMSWDGSINYRPVSPKFSNPLVRPQYGSLMDLFHKPDFHHDKLKDTEMDKTESEDQEAEEQVQEIVESVPGGSLTAAVFGIIKGMVGPAILYLPRGFANSGYAIAIPCLLIALMVYMYSANRLLQVWKAESFKGNLVDHKLGELQSFLEIRSPDPSTKPSSKPSEISREVSEDYDSVCVHIKTTMVTDETAKDKNPEFSDYETAPPTILSYPELARRAFGNKGCRIVTLGIALMQFGVCLTYLIFVPNNLHQSLKYLFGWDFPLLHLLIGMIAIEIPLSWIRDIRKLTPTNILATFLIMYGLASCLGFALFGRSQEHHAGIVDPYNSVFEKVLHLKPFNDTWYLFIGTSVSYTSLISRN